MRFPAALAGVFVCLVAGMAMLQPALNADLGWHLRTGYAILASHVIPTADPYSFTRMGAPWVDHEWLWQVAMASLDRAWGVMAIVLAHGALVSAAAWLVYGRLRLRGVAPLFAAAGTALGMVVVAFVGEIRPSLLVAPFAAAFLYAFEAYRRDGRTRWLLAVVPLEIVWANVHGSYIVPLLLCGMYGLGMVWERRRWQAALPWSGLFGALAAASAINPLGPNLLRFTLFASRLSFNRMTIAEWEAPEFRAWAFAPLLICIVLSVALAAHSRRWSRDRVQALLLAGATLAVLYSQQFVLVYAVAAAPCLAEMACELAGPRQERDLSPVSAAALLAAVAMFAIVPARRLAPEAYQRTVAETYPVQAVQYIKDAHLGGRMWNQFEWGGWLIGELPDIPVLVDGRTEMYGDPFMHRYARVALALDPAQPALDQYGIDFALIDANEALATELRQSPAWRLAYQDTQAAVFVRTDGRPS